MNVHPLFGNNQKTRDKNVICRKEKKLKKGQLHFCLQICSSGLHPIPLHISDKPIPMDCFIQASTSSDLWLSLASGSYQLETRRLFVVQRCGLCQLLHRPWVWPPAAAKSFLWLQLPWDGPLCAVSHQEAPTAATVSSRKLWLLGSGSTISPHCPLCLGREVAASSFNRRKSGCVTPKYASLT